MKRLTLVYVAAVLAAVLVQGFQCASTEVSSARKAIERKDFAKAKQQLTTALGTNPDNPEAMMMLAGVYDAQDQPDSAMIMYQRVLGSATAKPQQREMASVNLYNQWASAYNKGITAYNAAMTSGKDRAKLEEARDAFTRATRIKPEFTEPLGNLGETLERLGDTSQAAAAYARWWEAERSGAEAMSAAGVTLGSTRGKVLQIFGTPVKTKMDSIDGGLLYGDAFMVQGKRVYVFSYAEKSADAAVEGWRYDPSPTLSTPEMERPRILSVNPVKNLSFIAYARGQYVDALKWADIVAALKPSDNELGPLRAQCLSLTGQGEVAITNLKQQIAQDPTSTRLRMQLATMYSNMDKYADALQQYEQVLTSEPENEAALYDGAASAKNLASVKQREQIQLSDNNPRHVMDTTYLTLLAKAGGLFERLRKTSARFRDDFIVIGELANTYEVRKVTARVKELIAELEALEGKYAGNRDYYRVMEGLYARNKMFDKLKLIQEKGTKLDGK
jgi:tetratricopeptide (TPR) repeat protein